MFNAFYNFVSMHLIWHWTFWRTLHGQWPNFHHNRNYKKIHHKQFVRQMLPILTYALMPYEMIYYPKRSLTRKIYVLSANNLTHACWLIAWLKSDHMLMKFQEHLAIFSSMHSKMHYTVSSFKVALSIGLISSC